MIGLTVSCNAPVLLARFKKQKKSMKYKKGDVVGKIVKETPTMFITDTQIKLHKSWFGNDLLDGIYTIY
jgi:hypothetical protein